MADSCQTCRFWKKDTSLNGLCRRNAPKPDATRFSARWPRTKQDEWCGEFFDKDTIVAAPGMIIRRE